MEKYIKFILITLFLISSFKYSNTAACNTAGINKADCTANTTCQWTATPCKGSDACKTTANHAAQATCTAAKTGCTYTAADDSVSPAVEESCKTSTAACANGFTNKVTCENCQWDDTLGTCAEKSSNPNSNGETDGDDGDDGDFGTSLKFSGLIALLSLLF